MITNKTKIIKNTQSIFYNEFISDLKYIDKQIANDFIKVTHFQYKPKQAFFIIKLLNIYFYLNNIEINYLNFKNSNNKELFSNFLNFCHSDLFGYSLKFKQLIKNYLIRMIDLLNEQRTFKIEIDLNNVNFDYKINSEQFSNKLKILEGYIFKNGFKNIPLIHYSYHFDEKKALVLYDYIDLKSILFLDKESNVYLFNNLLDYCILNNKDFFKIDFYDLNYFAKYFFNKLNDRKINIEAYKQNWNFFIDFFNDAIKPINKDKLKILTKRTKGFQTNIKIENNKFIKTKLLVDVPLEISDEKSILKLKETNNQYIEIIESFSKEIIEDYINQQNIGTYPPDEFFTTDINILCNKYQMRKSGGIKSWIESNLNHNAVFNKTHAFCICSLLIINHPSITTQFLEELTVESFIKTDNYYYLVGEKRRKGKDFAEQKILLNEYTKSLIELLIENNKRFSRVYKSNKLFLHVNEHIKFKIFDSKIEPNKYTFDKLTSYINNNYEIDIDIDNFLKNVLFSKIRASCAIKLFFETSSTKKMAEILGHENYKPDLLSHYLPEPIIHFYQSRWIRIFQKGIIYESMKDSKFLLKAIGFKNIDTLNLFLSNHMIKDLPSTNINKSPVKDIVEYDECYISINEENLTALFSLKEAVLKSKNQNKINSTSLFWSDFADKLYYEIFNNKSYYSFQDILNKALKNINIKNFEEVIYE